MERITRRDIMKTIKCSVTEEQYTYLKTVVGFDNLEHLIRPCIEQSMRDNNYGNYIGTTR